jgi:hypothetical protein
MAWIGGKEMVWSRSFDGVSVSGRAADPGRWPVLSCAVLPLVSVHASTLWDLSRPVFNLYSSIVYSEVLSQ